MANVVYRTEIRPENRARMRKDGAQSASSSWIMVRGATHRFVGYAGLCALRVWLTSRLQMQFPGPDTPLSTVHCQLSTIQHPLTTDHCQPSTIHYQPSTIHYPPSTIHYPQLLPKNSPSPEPDVSRWTIPSRCICWRGIHLRTGVL